MLHPWVRSNERCVSLLDFFLQGRNRLGLGKKIPTCLCKFCTVRVLNFLSLFQFLFATPSLLPPSCFPSIPFALHSSLRLSHAVWALVSWILAGNSRLSCCVRLRCSQLPRAADSSPSSRAARWARSDRDTCRAAGARHCACADARTCSLPSRSTPDLQEEVT